MVRLSADTFIAYLATCRCIYIPVWLDYQLLAIGGLFGGVYIYIPVWLDYQRLYHIHDNANNLIYIPVWLDYQRTGVGQTRNGSNRFTFQYG